MNNSTPPHDLRGTKKKKKKKKGYPVPPTAGDRRSVAAIAARALQRVRSRCAGHCATTLNLGIMQQQLL